MGTILKTVLWRNALASLLLPIKNSMIPFKIHDAFASPGWTCKGCISQISFSLRGGNINPAGEENDVAFCHSGELTWGFGKVCNSNKLANVATFGFAQRLPPGNN